MCRAAAAVKHFGDECNLRRGLQRLAQAQQRAAQRHAVHAVEHHHRHAGDDAEQPSPGDEGQAFAGEIRPVGDEGGAGGKHQKVQQQHPPGNGGGLVQGAHVQRHDDGQHRHRNQPRGQCSAQDHIDGTRLAQHGHIATPAAGGGEAAGGRWRGVVAPHAQPQCHQCRSSQAQRAGGKPCGIARAGRDHSAKRRPDDACRDDGRRQFGHPACAALCGCDAHDRRLRDDEAEPVGGPSQRAQRNQCVDVGSKGGCQHGRRACKRCGHQAPARVYAARQRGAQHLREGQCGHEGGHRPARHHGGR
ncbi:hypothetical protein SDC9_146273 [bioreactor metagenome]|uniref:Uncharacterized protein n=1 Tax=bioreactor metagenome TaxID=1076179 RepID=A0A645EE91_9ZZZZ